MAWGRWIAGGRGPVRVREGLRLSPNEERYVLAETLTGQVYVAPSATRIQGPLDPDGLLAALQATCDRHEARRTGYERGPDGTFTKYVHDRATVHIERVSMPDASDEEVMDAVRAYCMRRGDLSPGELHRYMLIERAPDDYVWGMGLHHATSDGVSGMAFMWEVNARAQGLPVAETVSQYSNFWDRDWMASDAYREAEAFWMDRFRDVAEVAAWPPDLAGEPAPARLGEVVELDAGLVERTKQAAAAIGVTHFSYFYAVYVVLLSRLTGTGTVCTTFQSAGRRGIPGADSTLGVFSNALMLATEVDETRSIAELAGRMRQEVKAAIAHEIFPLHHLIRKTGLHPRYAINWFPTVPEFKLKDGVTYSSLPMQQNQDDDDLNLRFITHQDQVRLALFYDPALFSADRVAAALRLLVALADAFARDVNRPIAEIPSSALAAPGLLPDLSEPLPEGGDETIFARFLARAKETPDALAVVHGETSLSYADVESRSRRLAGRLRQGGVGPGDRVAILADRTPELVWSMLAVARLGAAFVVLDRAYPEPRLADFLEIAAPRAIVWAGDDALKAVAERLALEPGLAVFGAGDLAPEGSIPDGLDRARSQDPAYLLFTSGSTGRPRCVACSHQPLVHFVDWQARTFGLRPFDRFTMLSGLSHDPLLRDVFSPLSVGAAVLIPDAAVITEPGALAPWIDRAGATVAHLTPQMGQILTAGASRLARLRALRHVFWGGDLLRPEVVDAVRRLAPDAAQTNFYGATETPQAAGAYRIEAGPERSAVPVGVGIEGVQLVVVDAARRPVGIGEFGEIAVRSNFLPLGYVEKGRINPAADDRGEDAAGRRNIHYTGDRGYYLPDGAVMVVGRGDDQVKVRGARVHLSEVSAALRASPGVRDAVALAAGEGEHLSIAAFVTGRRPTDEAGLKASVAARLPAYMTPHRIVWLESFPLLPNGKVDRRALLERLEAPPPAPQVATNGVERALMEKWSQILGGVAVSRDSTFASLGGDSLSYVQAYMATEEVLGEAPTDWRQMTIAELAALKREKASVWGAIDTPLVMRALAILVIVAGHFQYARYQGGATSALMLVSGFMFGSLAIKEVFAKQSAAPVLRVVVNIFIPTAILSGFIWLTRLQGQAPPAHILLFTADLVDHEKLGTGREIYLWFVHCLLHMMLLIWLAVLGLKAARRFDIGPKAFLYGLFGVACVLRFGLPPLIDPEFYVPGHQHSLRLDFLPTSNLATLILGALVATASTWRERLWLAPILAAFSAVTALGFGVSQAIFLLVGAGVLLVVPRLPVPRLASPAILGLAGASLWIYLTHMLVRDGLKAVDAPAPLLLGVVLSLAGGVAFWLAWTKGADLVRRLFRRPAATVDATV